MCIKAKVFLCVACYAFSMSVLAQYEGLSDPTKPLRSASQKTVSHTALSLSAIVERSGTHFAIINDTRVYEGDAVAGVTIEKINAGKVVYFYNGERHDLYMRVPLIQ